MALEEYHQITHLSLQLLMNESFILKTLNFESDLHRVQVMEARHDKYLTLQKCHVYQFTTEQKFS
jgi:hypothetical protein